MGLLTKEIEINLSSQNIEYYEELGYEIPRYYNKSSCTWRVKRGTKIIVNISDVPVNSHIKVDLDCNCCGKKYKALYLNYSRQNHKGKTYCANCSRTILNSGENSACWKDSITMEDRENGRKYLEYTNFIKRVLARDDYTCKCCGKKCVKMEVHHLDGYDWCKEKRIDDTNGITLCSDCHKSFHSVYGYGGNTRKQFEKWTGYAINQLKKYHGILPTTRKVYCLEDNYIYDSIKQAAQTNVISPACINKCCNKVGYNDNKKHSIKSVGGKHYFWLDDFEKMTQTDLDDYMEWTKSFKYNRKVGKDHPISKSVICTTTGKVFDTLTEGAKFYGICGASLISRCCNGKAKHCGKLEDGTKLQWMYYSDYLESTTSSDVSA